MLQSRSTAAATVPPSPPLRLYTSADTPGGQLSPQMSLSQFYRAFFRPVILVAKRAAQRNLDQYDQSIACWCRLSGDPPLKQIDDFTIATFMTALGQLPGKKKGELISDNTIIKHCVHLQAVIDRAGPRSRTKHLRKAQGLIEEVPYFERPERKDKPPEDDYALEEITAIMTACRGVTTPSYLATQRHREVFWVELLMGDYNLGLRIGSVPLLEWSRLREDKAGKWWITVLVKGRKEQKVYVNAGALRSIEAMRPITGHMQQIWPWPHGQHWLQEQRRRILADAGIPPERRFGFHGLRKAMCTHAADINPLGATLQAGHKSERTTREHYVNPKIVATTMDQLPQPKRPGDEHQQRLF